MCYTRYLPVTLVTLGTVALTGALNLPPRAAILSAQPGQPPDPSALRFLDEALTRYAPDRIGWLEVTVSQHVNLPGISFDTEGRYLQAPGNRFRTELCTRQGDAEGTWLAVADGIRRREAHRVGTGRWQDEPVPAGSLASPASAGVPQMLRDLRDRLEWVGRDSASANERVRLTGVWKPGLIARFAPPGKPWPEGLPSHCRLDLDTRTLWPQRIEWWGPLGASSTPVLLAWAEFGMPVLGRTCSAEECNRLFSIDTVR